MYRTCIFCSGDLGANEAVEEFPVGRSLAFDAERGRLWAVCGGCARWNLAPIEERWEAVESAEKLFRDSRLRVHSENIGLAKLPDGTRLIRVGKALPRELAAWRYGDQLIRRRKQMLILGGVGAAATATVLLGGIALASAAAAAPLFHLAVNGGSLVKAAWLIRNQNRVLHQLPPGESPTGEAFNIRVVHMQYAQLVPDPEADGVALRVSTLGPLQRVEDGRTTRWTPPPPLLVRGDEAQRLLAKTMTRANATGAKPGQLDGAFARLTENETRDAFLRRLSKRRVGLFPSSFFNQPGSQSGPLRMPDVKGAWQRFQGTFRGERVAGNTTPVLKRRLSTEDALALEIALNEETERRFLEGELKLLEVAWREAEEIAAIADVLPDDPLQKLKQEEHRA
jgi:hypothetical protein